MSAEDLERYEAEMELQLYREYRDVVAMFSHVVETERRFYLANEVTVTPQRADGQVWFELDLRDAWVWDMYRPARFVQQVHVLTFRDVNVERLAPSTDDPPPFLASGTLPVPPQQEPPGPGGGRGGPGGPGASEGPSGGPSGPRPPRDGELGHGVEPSQRRDRDLGDHGRGDRRLGDR